ncbi:MAG: thiamine pyrophosphate-dependent dehydrogenase E1 component subunit alpha, partial [Victivallales bacterium]|nr:thiamine pyrophosphate-dependent dehydrogenase E1 component subunit alpha [Victivallales bacterium]
YNEYKMRCPVHLCIGQEAIASVIGCLLKKDDLVVSTHRSHGHYLGKGGNLNAMIAEIYGKATGCSNGKGGSMHLIDERVGFKGSTAIVAGTIPVGVGLGLANKLQKKNNISCIFFGDGSTEEGLFYESVNFAVLKNLPVLFICENNLYSVYTPLAIRQPKNRTIYEMVKGMGCFVNNGNGNDVIDVYNKSSEAISLIKKGEGPVFLEFSTYRWREHCGPNYDNDLGYRTTEEFENWKKNDPILNWQNYLLTKQIITDEIIINMENLINKEIAVAFEYAEKTPFPNENELFKGVLK